MYVKQKVDVIERCDIEPDKIDENETNYYYDESGSLKEYVEDIPRFKTEVDKVIHHLKMAHTMVQRIDWFLSGDDGEDSFYRRLQTDLSEIEKQKNELICF